jgi:uncharacterized protein (TIGR02453 family)
MTFDGFPAEAFEFYERLEADNSKAFWAAHSGDYLQYVREPLTELAEELEAEFGPSLIFRPYRDIRFSADKSPYKTHQGMFAERVLGIGFYLQVSADGILVSGGFYSHTSDQVDRYRQAVDADSSGLALATVVAKLQADGLSIGGERLKTKPRGVTADHPRLELLRHRSLTGGRDWPAGPDLSGSEALDLVRDTWRQLVPLCDWSRTNVGGPQA